MQRSFCSRKWHYTLAPPASADNRTEMSYSHLSLTASHKTRELLSTKHVNREKRTLYFPISGLRLSGDQQCENSVGVQRYGDVPPLSGVDNNYT
jgi:hypothetical protein